MPRGDRPDPLDGPLPRPPRRGWVTVLVLTAIAVVAALVQADPVGRLPFLVEHEPASIAHAGAQGHAPSNTLPAFETAVDQGANVLEMDLQLTADDVVVVIHDETVDRTTDGTGRVREMTLDEIKELDAGHYFEGPDGDFPFRGEGVEVPTLEEVFTAFPDEWMLIEMKTESGPEIVQATADVVREHGREDLTIAASFDLDFLVEFRELIPEIPTNMPETEGRDFHVHMLLGTYRWWDPPAEFLQVPIDFEGMRVITPGFVRAAEHRGVDVHAWTINDPTEMHWLLNQGVHGIITDYPDVFEEVLEARVLAAERRADPVLYPGLGFVQATQDRFAWLTALMEAITFLGDEEFYVFAFPLIFWSVHRTVGIHLGFLFLVSVALNDLLKLVGRTPRPSFVDPSLALRVESSFGMPSGHAQNAVVVWGFLATVLRRPWAWAVAGVLILLLGFSRLQLGVHFPIDTVTGWLIGATLLLAYLYWHEAIGRWIVALTPRRQVWLAFGISVGLVLGAVAVRLVFLGWEIPAEWTGMDPTHPPMRLSSVVTPAATLFGFGAGLVFLRNRGGFSSAGPVWQRALRYPIGLVGVIVIWSGLGELFPGGEDPIALAFRYLRYSLVGMWVGGLAPLLFVRSGLAAPDPAFTAAPRSTEPAGRA
jgi:glycerophosphoryl diester phosphodiesterase/membrane-associated phospholipid phosphatase